MLRSVVESLEQVVLLIFTQLARFLAYWTYSIDNLVAEFFLERKHVVVSEQHGCFVCFDAFQCRVDPQQVGDFRPHFRVVSQLAQAVGLGLTDLGSDRFGLVHYVDACKRRRVTFGHFLLCVLERHYSAADELGLLEVNVCRLWEQFAEQPIEPLGQVFCKLQMLSLVLTDWNQIGLVEQDISSHQYRVRVQAQRREPILLGLLFLELNHLVEPAEWRQCRQEPHHLRVRADM